MLSRFNHTTQNWTKRYERCWFTLRNRRFYKVQKKREESLTAKNSGQQTSIARFWWTYMIEPAVPTPMSLFGSLGCPKDSYLKFTIQEKLKQDALSAGNLNNGCVFINMKIPGFAPHAFSKKSHLLWSPAATNVEPRSTLMILIFTSCVKSSKTARMTFAWPVSPNSSSGTNLPA